MIHMSTVLMISMVITAAISMREKRVPGGTRVTDPTKYPFMISVRSDNDEHICGGYLTELEGRQIVMTAAHCIYDSETRMMRNVLTVRAGTLLSDPGEGTEGYIMRSFILKNYLDPSESEFRRERYDLAILVPFKPFDTSDIIQPIQLESQPITGISHLFKDCYIIGWGGVGTYLTEAGGKIISVGPTFISVQPTKEGISASSLDYGGPLVCKKWFETEWHALGTLSIFHHRPLPTYYYMQIGSYKGNFDMVELIGGELISAEEFPFIVSLRDATGRHVCGGFLTKADVVITTADCLFEKKNRTVLDVTSVRIGTNYTDDHFGKERQVQRRFVHQHAVSSYQTLYDVGYLLLENFESTEMTYLPLDHEPVPLDEFHDCQILNFGARTGTGTDNKSWKVPDGIKIYPHLRKLPGIIKGEQSGAIIVQTPACFFCHFEKWAAISKEADRGCPLVCKRGTHTEWHVVGLLDQKGQLGDFNNSTIRITHVKVGSFLQSFVMVELL